MRKILIFLLLVLIAADAWLAWALFLPVSPSGQKFVLLRSGYSTRRIATELKNAGVIRNASAFVIWHYFHRGRSLKAGEYLFEKPGNVAQVHRRLSHGDIYVHTVVIPEGFTIFDVAQAIQDAGLGPSNEFLSLAKSGVQKAGRLRGLTPRSVSPASREAPRP